MLSLSLSGCVCVCVCLPPSVSSKGNWFPQAEQYISQVEQHCLRDGFGGTELNLCRTIKRKYHDLSAWILLFLLPQVKRMGSPFTANYTNLVIGLWENKHIEKYVNDIFMGFTGSEDELKVFSKYINGNCPTFHFTTKYSHEKYFGSFNYS